MSVYYKSTRVGNIEVSQESIAEGEQGGEYIHKKKKEDEEYINKIYNPTCSNEILHSSSSSLNNISQNIDFGDTPIECKCIHCHNDICTHVEFQSSWVTFILSFFVFCIFGWIAFCLLPFLWPLFQDAVHTCPRCMNVINRKQRISFPSVKNEIITVKCGNCAVVLSRKYVFVFFLMISLIFLFYIIRLYVKIVVPPDLIKGEETNLGWEDFVKKCGIKNSIGNPLNSLKNFDEFFYKKTVKWTGKVHKVHESVWANNIIEIQMNPSQYRSSDMADLALMFDRELNSKVADLHVGDIIKLEATLTEFGRRGNPHFGMLWNFTVAEKYDEADDNKGLNPIQLIGHLSSLFQHTGMGMPNKVIIVGHSPMLFSRIIGGIGEDNDENTQTNTIVHTVPDDSNDDDDDEYSIRNMLKNYIDEEDIAEEKSSGEEKSYTEDDNDKQKSTHDIYTGNGHADAYGNTSKKNIDTGEVTEEKIKKGEITEEKIKKGEVTEEKINEQPNNEEKIKEEKINEEKIIKAENSEGQTNTEQINNPLEKEIIP